MVCGPCGKKKDLEEKDAAAAPKSKERMYIEDNQFLTDDKRKCRDVLFLILFLIMWMGMFIIAGVSLGKGDPKKLFYGQDHAGRQCGGKGTVIDYEPGSPAEGTSYDFTKLTYTAYPQLSLDIQKALAAGIQDPTKITLTGECVSACPLQTDIAQVAKTYPLGKAKVADKGADGKILSALCTSGKCWPEASINTESLFFRCLPKKEEKKNIKVQCVKLNANVPSGSESEGGTTTPTAGTAAAPGTAAVPGAADLIQCGETQASCEAKIKAHFEKLATEGDGLAKAQGVSGCATSEIIDTSRITGPANKDPIYEQLSGTFQKVARWVGDVEKSAVPILISGGLCGIVFSMIYLFICGKCATLMVSLVVALIMVTLFAITFYLGVLGNLVDVSNYCTGAQCDELTATAAASADKESLYAALCYFFAAVTAIVFVMLIFMRSRLKLATKMITLANANMMKRKTIFLWPFVPTLLSIVFLVYFVIIGAYIATAGETEYKDGDGGVTTTPPNATAVLANPSLAAAEYAGSVSMQYLLAYHLFGFIWTKDLLEAIGAFVIASVVAGVYWGDEENKTRAVRQGIRRALKFHLGSLAFGSLILAIIEFIRIVLEYIDHKIKKAAEHNKLLKMMMCCLRSFAWCLQKCVEFINKNTYILVACRGQSFCTSAKEAFTIILANIATVATVSTITNFLILLGKVTITCLCMLIFNGFINGAEWVENIPTFQANVDMGTISSPIFPMLVVLLFAFAISSYFLNIYSMSIDTVLMCYMVDTKEYKVKFDGLYMAADPDLDSTLKLADAKYGMAIHKSKGKRSAKGGTPTAESGVREAELSVVPGTGQEGEA